MLLGLKFMHDSQVIHRDLKPSNIMIGKFGQVFVVDWGIAKILPNTTQHEEPIEIDTTENYHKNQQEYILGTPVHMAPEQAWGEQDKIGTQSDIYALGSILYTILAGRTPYVGDAISVIKAKQVLDPIPLHNQKVYNNTLGCDIPNQLAKICEKAMERDLTNRYVSALDMAEELQAWLEGAQRSQKALSIIKEVNQIEKQITLLQLEKEKTTNQANLIFLNAYSQEDQWELWLTIQNKQKQIKEKKQQIARLLQRALIYDPELQEINRRLIRIEYEGYLAALLRCDHRIANKISAKLKLFMEMVTPKEQIQWKRKRTIDERSINLYRKKQPSFIERTEMKEQVIFQLEQSRWVSLIGTDGVGKIQDNI